MPRFSVIALGGRGPRGRAAVPPCMTPLIVAVGALMLSWGAGLGVGIRWGARPAADFRGALVVIDPGHGGRDPGAVGRAGVREKDVALAVALQLQTLLHRAGVYTRLTRTDDNDLADADATVRKPQDLRRRAEIANAAAADVFVSIHANSFPSSIWSGAQTFYYPADGEGKKLAEAIQDALHRVLGPTSRRPQPGNYRVLRDTVMPAVVVELGFLSNPAEERLLADPAYQERLAHALYEGILAYFGHR